MDATSPFTFWRVNESSVMRFLKLIGCDNSKVGSFTALVKERKLEKHHNVPGIESLHQSLRVAYVEPEAVRIA